MSKQTNNKNVENKDKKKLAPANKKSLKNGSYSAVLTVIVIAAIVVINLAVSTISSKYTMIDVSTQKLYTIGEETKKTLDDLDQDITIYYLTDNSSEDTTITMLLDNYKAYSKHIRVEEKDPAVYPGFASQYTEDSLTTNSLIVVCGDKSRALDYSTDLYISTMNTVTYQDTQTEFDGEGQVTAAINYVTSDETPVVYNITGHDEAALDSSLQKEIEKQNLEIKDLTLLTEDGIPEDAAAVIISAPASDYSADDAEKVENYLDAGGKALIITNYTDEDMKNFTAMLADYNVELLDGVIIEGDSQRFTSQNPMYMVPEVSETSNLTKAVREKGGLVFSPISQGLRTIDEDSDVSVEYLLTSSAQAYVKSDLQNLETYAKEDGDEEGPFAVGASVYKTVDDDQMRMVVFTSASFAMSSADEMVSGSNFQILTDCMSWLTNVDEDRTIASKSIELNFLTVPAAKVLRYSVILVAVIPVLLLIFGGSVWFIRRKK